MQVSNEGVKRFLLDLINQAKFPGEMAEFIVTVKAEVANAVIEQQVKDFSTHPHHSGETPSI